MELKGISAKDDDLERFIITKKYTSSLNRLITKRSISLTLHSEEIFDLLLPKFITDITTDKNIRRLITPCWKQILKLIKKVFKKNLGYGSNKEVEIFFQNLHLHNPALLKLVGYQDGEITIKNLERLGDKFL